MSDLILSPERPAVVGIVHDAESLAQIKRGLVSEETCDLLEIRLDALETAGTVSPFIWFGGAQGCSSLPLLVTARSPREGGLNNLDPRERSAMLLGACEECFHFETIAPCQLAPQRVGQ